MAKKVAVIIVIIVLLAGLFMYVGMSLTHKEQSAVGTYCTGDGISGNEVYITIYTDDEYVIYRQFDTLSRGVCEFDVFDRIVRITLNGEDGSQMSAFFDRNDVLLLEGEFNGVATRSINLQRISKTPLEINISE